MVSGAESGLFSIIGANLSNHYRTPVQNLSNRQIELYLLNNEIAPGTRLFNLYQKYFRTGLKINRHIFDALRFSMEEPQRKIKFFCRSQVTSSKGANDMVRVGELLNRLLIWLYFEKSDSIETASDVCLKEFLSLYRDGFFTTRESLIDQPSGRQITFLIRVIKNFYLVCYNRNVNINNNGVNYRKSQRIMRNRVVDQGVLYHIDLKIARLLYHLSFRLSVPIELIIALKWKDISFSNQYMVVTYPEYKRTVCFGAEEKEILSSVNTQGVRDRSPFYSSFSERFTLVYAIRGSLERARRNNRSKTPLHRFFQINEKM